MTQGISVPASLKSLTGADLEWFKTRFAIWIAVDEKGIQNVFLGIELNQHMIIYNNIYDYIINCIYLYLYTYNFTSHLTKPQPPAIN